jgi:hypothetical protein
MPGQQNRSIAIVGTIMPAHSGEETSPDGNGRD